MTNLVLRLALLLLLLIPALAQGQGQDSLRRPYVYKMSVDERARPDYIVTGRRAVALVWQPGRRNPSDEAWTVRLLGPHVEKRLEISLNLATSPELVLAEEDATGQAVWLLLREPARPEQLTLLKLSYVDGRAESVRVRLPVAMTAEQMVPDAYGVYLRGLHDASQLVFYLSLDNPQPKVLAYGPDRRNRYLGSGLEAATGRYVLVMQSGRGRAATSSVRYYMAGLYQGEIPIQGLPQGQVPATTFLAGVRADSLLLGCYGIDGDEDAQGPVSLRGLTVAHRSRFVDSLHFFDYLGPKQGARQFKNFSAKPNFRLRNRFYFHTPQPVAGGGYLLAAERYLTRSRPYVPGALYGGMDPFAGRNPEVREYEASYLLQMWFGPAGQLQRLHSIPVPSQLYYELRPQLVALPDRPPLMLYQGEPRFYGPSQEKPGTFDWLPLQKAALGFTDADQVRCQAVLQEHDVAYAWGTAYDRGIGKEVFFISRLP